MMEEIRKYPSGKKGICVNCRREKFINDRHGHCKSCGDAVKGLTPDTPEWVAALASVKELLTNKHFNKIGKEKGAVPDKPTPPPPPPKEDRSTFLSKKSHDVINSVLKEHVEQIILDVLEVERKLLMDQLNRINRAIEVFTA